MLAKWNKKLIYQQVSKTVAKKGKVSPFMREPMGQMPKDRDSISTNTALQVIPMLVNGLTINRDTYDYEMLIDKNRQKKVQGSGDRFISTPNRVRGQFFKPNDVGVKNFIQQNISSMRTNREETSAQGKYSTLSED